MREGFFGFTSVFARSWFCIGDDASDDFFELFGEAAGIVLLSVFGAELFDFGGHFCVSVCGDIGEEVVFDLVAEVSTEDVEQFSTCEVAGALDLSPVPVSFAFVV